MGGEGFRGTFVGASGELRIPALRSRVYEEGTKGWRLSADGRAEVQALAVRESLGTSMLFADTFNLGGVNIGEELSQQGTGCVGWGDHTVDSPQVVGETGYFEIAFPLKAGRLYEFRTSTVRCQSTVAGDFIDLRLRLTTDGSTPTPSSPLVHGAFGILAGRPGFINRVHKQGSADVDKARLLLTLQRGSGTGNVFIDASASTGKRAQLYVVDLGSKAPRDLAVVNNSTATTTSTATNTVRTTKTYPAVWSNTFKQSGAQRTDKDGNLTMYQGYYDSFAGDQRSLFGFDSTLIMSDTSGATIVACTVTFKVQHEGSSTGLDCILSSHNYTSKPSTWDGANVIRDRARLLNVREGTSGKIDLGTTIGGEFKSGATRGLGFGPSGNSSYVPEEYGYLFGAGTSSRPVLAITYDK